MLGKTSGAWVEESMQGTGKSYNFAKSVMAGMAYKLTDQWSMDLGYRYIDFGEAFWGGMFGYPVEAKEVKAEEVYLGVRFQH